MSLLKRPGGYVEKLFPITERRGLNEPAVSFHWNAADAEPTWTVSADATSITRSASGSSTGIRSIVSRSSGLIHARWWWDGRGGNVSPGPGRLMFGFANGTYSLTTSLGVTDTNSAGYRDDGIVYYNGGSTTIASFVLGDYVDGVYDFTNGKVYFRRAGGWWNNSSSANPGTNTGGIAASISGNVYAACSSDGGTMTVRSGDPVLVLPTGVTTPWG